MKATHIEYSKVFNLGNYSNEKIGITLEVEQGDDPQKVLEHARAFVTLNAAEVKEKIAHAQRVLADPDNHTGYEVKGAERYLENIQAMKDDLGPIGLLDGPAPPTGENQDE